MGLRRGGGSGLRLDHLVEVAGPVHAVGGERPEQPKLPDLVGAWGGENQPLVAQISLHTVKKLT